MRIIDKGIVFSNDIVRILNGKNALDFNYEQNGMKLPSEEDIEILRADFRKDVNRIFKNNVEIISEEEMEKYVQEVLQDSENIPIVSLDKIYLYDSDNNDNDIYYLDCTRMKRIKRFSTKKGK